MGRILLVDDEPSVRQAVSRVLELAGHQVTVADDGTTALREIRQNPPDLLLTDLHMPGLDGFKLLEAVRKLSAPMKIIVFSGYGGSHLLDLARMLGAQGTLEKPFTSEQLLQALQQVGV
jgi:CheY-like chemotaxis protein